MYSIKPGRGPSAMGAVGGVFAAIFGVIWTVSAASMGAPPMFALFGVVFVLMAIGGVVYNAYNATQKNRMSSFDITSGREEVDPIARAMGFEKDLTGSDPAERTPGRKYEGAFCPFCGAEARPDFDFCPKCGKDI